MSAASLVKSLTVVYKIHEDNKVYKMDGPVRAKCVTVTDV
jgi:hypothetical protein